MESYYLSFYCFILLIVLGFFYAFSLKTLPAAREGMKRQERGFSREFNSVK